jgi:hypothetical protein
LPATNNLDVKTIAPAHGSGAKPYNKLKQAIRLIPLRFG